LEYLVGVHNVERRIGELKVIDVADPKRKVHAVRGLGAATGQLNHFVGEVDANHAAGFDETRNVGADRTRPATNVEH
jgi:hypothetical protein